MSFGLNKALSLGIPLLLIVAMFGFEEAESRWSWLLLFALTFGYTHVIVGAVYQWNALKAANQLKAQLYFILMIVLATGVGLAAWSFNLTGQYIFLIILGFIIHGALNDFEFFEKYTKYSLDRVNFISTNIYVLGTLLLVSLLHPSTFIVPNDRGTLTFPFNTTEKAREIFEQMFFPADLLPKVIVGAFLLYALINLYATFKNRLQFTTILVVTVVGIFSFYMSSLPSIPFAYLLFMIFSHHFFTWFFLYYERFLKVGRQRLWEYILWHLVIVVPIVASIVWLSLSSNEDIAAFFKVTFNMQFYYTIGLAHLLTSLLNEPWMKQRLQTS